MNKLAPRPDALQAQDGQRSLTFALQGEIFAIEASSVREILDLPPITEVPNAPAFANGLVNVRGRVVPLADLRIAFGMERTPPDQDTRIIVIEIPLEDEVTIVGILADKVLDVCELEAVSIEEAPSIGMRWRPDFVLGVGRHGGDFVILPNIARVFAEHIGAPSTEMN